MPKNEKVATARQTISDIDFALAVGATKRTDDDIEKFLIEEYLTEVSKKIANCNVTVEEFINRLRIMTMTKKH